MEPSKRPSSAPSRLSAGRNGFAAWFGGGALNWSRCDDMYWPGSASVSTRAPYSLLRDATDLAYGWRT